MGQRGEVGKSGMSSTSRIWVGADKRNAEGSHAATVIGMMWKSDRRWDVKRPFQGIRRCSQTFVSNKTTMPAKPRNLTGFEDVSNADASLDQLV